MAAKIDFGIQLLFNSKLLSILKPVPVDRFCDVASVKVSWVIVGGGGLR
jgi:hypothetical protein